MASVIRGRLAVACCVALFAGCTKEHRNAVPEDRAYLSMLDWAALSNERAVFDVRQRFEGQTFPTVRHGKPGPDLPLLNSLSRARQAVVRVDVAYEPNRTTSGTGILVDGGRHVLTCAHVVQPAMEKDWSRIRIFVRRELGNEIDDNDIYTCKVVESRLEEGDEEVDWCLLKVLSPAKSMPFVEIGEAQPGQILLGYGFPGEIGIDRLGRAKWWTRKDHLDPVLVVLRVPEDSTWRYDAVAGGRPIGGMSGGPLFDTSGAVVGLLTGHTRTITSGEAEFWVRTSRFERAVELLRGG